jgi:serine/threonine protein kinase
MSTRGGFERVPAPVSSESFTGYRTGRPVGEQTQIPAGTVIAERYRVERVLGEGAMGIVLAARHLELDELVAIKCIRATMPWSSDVIARFAREAKSCARLKSEHIAKVIDVGVSAPVGPYMVMEYLEGQDLAALLKSYGPLPVRRAAEFVMQVCEALAVAHASSITHRDVKPENLFLTRHGDLEIIKVLDFGISKATVHGRAFGGEISVKETSFLMGTPLYMSPEQIRSTREVDHRSDLWSLGVVLFELLTGRPAFAGETVTQVCALVLEASPPKLSEHCRGAPDGLARIIERCLEKDPADRYQSAGELANALLPFAPPRARLHAERAKSVLRVLDPELQLEPLPSTLPEGGGGQRPSVGTAAPTVLGADLSLSHAGRRRSALAMVGVSLLGILCGFVAWRALRGSGDSRVNAVALSAPSASPAEPVVAHGHEPPSPSRIAQAPNEGRAEDSATRRAPAPSHATRRAEARNPRGKARAASAVTGGGSPLAAKVAPSEPALNPVAAETKPPSEPPRPTTGRARLVEESTPVRLLE